jgi:hypothetical protein
VNPVPESASHRRLYYYSTAANGRAPRVTKYETKNLNFNQTSCVTCSGQLKAGVGCWYGSRCIARKSLDKTDFQYSHVNPPRPPSTYESICCYRFDARVMRIGPTYRQKWWDKNITKKSGVKVDSRDIFSNQIREYKKYNKV